MHLVSFVVPTLREEDIAAVLVQLSGHLTTIKDCRFEILLVDDSPEPYKRTLDTAIAQHDTRFAPTIVARRIDGPRRGKGAAIRVGMGASRGDVVFMMDADIPVPLENVQRFLDLIAEGNDLVIGERPLNRSLGQPVRFVASRVLYGFQRVLLRPRAFSDTQCGFKAFVGDLARSIAQQQIVDGGMVDIEYLFVAIGLHARVARVPVTCNPETRESKINVKKALLQDPVDLVRIQWNGMRGRYRGVMKP